VEPIGLQTPLPERTRAATLEPVGERAARLRPFVGRWRAATMRPCRTPVILSLTGRHPQPDSGQLEDDLESSSA